VPSLHSTLGAATPSRTVPVVNTFVARRLNTAGLTDATQRG